MTDHSGNGRPIPKVAELFRSRIEAEYYGQVSAQATLESVACDAEFLRDPMSHVALYSDHGIAHVRDVVRQVVHVIDTIHGVLIPFRPPVRLDFLRGYGVLLAYLHDIGMRDFSAFGHRMGPAQSGSRQPHHLRGRAILRPSPVVFDALEQLAKKLIPRLFSPGETTHEGSIERAGATAKKKRA